MSQFFPAPNPLEQCKCDITNERDLVRVVDASVFPFLIPGMYSPLDRCNSENDNEANGGHTVGPAPQAAIYMVSEKIAAAVKAGT